MYDYPSVELLKDHTGSQVNGQPVVSLKGLLESDAFKNSDSCLTVAFGKDDEKRPAIADIYDFPHLLIAGESGSGKTMLLHSMITSLLYKSAPEEVKLLLIGPKGVDFDVYNGIPHLIRPVITDTDKAIAALHWVAEENDDHYDVFAQAGVRNIGDYNEVVRNSHTGDIMSRIVAIIDELSELTAADKTAVEDLICRITQKGRAAGIHLIASTQRPSIDVITGVIQANIPSRIAFAVADGDASRVILNVKGAEGLKGSGDMLYWPMSSSEPIHIQGCYISNDELESVTNVLKASVRETSDKNDAAGAMQRLYLKNSFVKLSEDAVDIIMKARIEDKEDLLDNAFNDAFWGERLPEVSSTDRKIIIRESFKPDHYKWRHDNPDHLPAIIRFKHTWNYSPAWKTDGEPDKQVLEIDRVSGSVSISNLMDIGKTQFELKLTAERDWLEEFFKSCENTVWQKDYSLAQFDKGSWDVELKPAVGKKIKQSGFEPPDNALRLAGLIKDLLLEKRVGTIEIHVLGL